MGLTDWFNDATDTLKRAAKASIETAERLAQEAKRELERGLREAEEILNSLTGKVRSKADDIEHDLKAAVPSFDGKLEEILNNITETASNAAENGIDISESIDGAVDMVLAQIQQALDGAVDAVNRFMHDAADSLFRLLDGLLPEILNRLLEPVRELIRYILHGLDSLAESLKTGVKTAVEKIKSTARRWVKEIGEVLGPIWDYIKKLWKLLFDSELEECELTAQWFDEMMKRTEQEILSSGQQVLIRKRTYFEVLPPGDGACRSVLSDFLNTSPVWIIYRERLMSSITAPGDGRLIHVSVNEPHMDQLGGQQQIHISVFQYRWRTEGFRKISAGFLGILAMVSTTRKEHQAISLNAPPRQREKPLDIDSQMALKIYRTIEPYLWLHTPVSQHNIGYTSDNKARVSNRVLIRDENGWSENVAQVV